MTFNIISLIPPVCQYLNLGNSKNLGRLTDNFIPTCLEGLHGMHFESGDFTRFEHRVDYSKHGSNIGLI